MNLEDIKLMSSVLSEEVGWTWPLLLIKCLTKTGPVFSNTHWAKDRGAESEFAKRLSVVAALYLELIKKVGKAKAFEIMRRILVPGSVAEMRKSEDSLNILEKKGMDRVLTLWRFFDQGGGPGQFNQGTFIRQDDDVLHYEVRNCFFAGFYQETGTPELARLFCESDREYWPQVAPDVEFHRGGSWENTIAYGKDHCKFIFERKP